MNKLLTSSVIALALATGSYATDNDPELQNLLSGYRTPPHQIGKRLPENDGIPSHRTTFRSPSPSPCPIPATPTTWGGFLTSFIETFSSGHCNTAPCMKYDPNLLTIICETLQQIEISGLANYPNTNLAAARQEIYLAQLKYISQFTELGRTDNSWTTTVDTTVGGSQIGGNIFFAGTYQGENVTYYLMPFITFLQTRSQIPNTPWYHKLCGWSE